MALLLTSQEQDNVYDNKIGGALANVALNDAICKFTVSCVAFLNVDMKSRVRNSNTRFFL